MADGVLATGVLWRDTARPIRFFFFDAKVLIGLFLWAVHMSWVTFYIAMISMTVFTIVELFGVRPMAALRIMKNFWKNKNRFIKRSFLMKRRARW